MKATILALALLVIAQPCLAQPVMGLWVYDQGTFVDQYYILPTFNFDVVVLLDTDGHDLSLVEWSMTELSDVAPGLISLGMTSAIGDCGLIPETCMDGDYTIFVNGCNLGGPQIPVARFTFVDFSGAAGLDIVGEIGPNSSGLIAGSPGFLDCDDIPVSSTIGGSPGGTTGSGVVWPPGGMVINPTALVPVAEPGFSALKSRY